MIITTKELYEIGWFVFKLFAIYRVISTSCAVIFAAVQYICERKNHDKKALELRKKVANKDIIEPIESNYKSTRMGFMNDDTVLNKTEP